MYAAVQEGGKGLPKLIVINQISVSGIHSESAHFAHDGPV